MTNEVNAPKVPCDECMKLFSAEYGPSEFIAIYCWHRVSLALYSPKNRRWEMRNPLSLKKLRQWIDNTRDLYAPALCGTDEERERDAESMIAALDRLEASTFGISGVH